MHLQRNATQRNAYQNYILLLTNNFKFYILQILGHLNFLSVGFVLQNIFSFNKNSCSFFVEKKNQKTTTFFVKKVDKKTTSLVFKNLIVKTFSQYLESLFVNKLIYAFSYALKNQFEIISRNENYAFNHNKNFYRNGNNIFLRNGYGGNFIFGFWSNFNFGFLFNRKINSKKILFQKEKKR